MIVGKYTKQPYEQVALGVDFVYELQPEDDTIQTLGVSATNVDTGEDAPDILEGGPLLGDSVILDAQGLPIRANSRLVQRIKDGTSPGKYLLAYRIATALDFRWEGDVYLVVQET